MPFMITGYKAEGPYCSGLWAITERPDNNHCHCWWLSMSASPVSLSRHLNRSFSSRLYHRAKPVLSQYSTFILLRFLLQKTNTWPPNTSCSSSCSTMALKPLIDLRKSTGWRCSSTCLHCHRIMTETSSMTPATDCWYRWQVAVGVYSGSLGQVGQSKWGNYH